MKLTTFLMAVCLGLFSTANLLAVKVEKLTPPIITEETIDQKISCTRPMREGKFNISTEETDGKIIVNCYGHGGSGCTTVFGSVAKAIQLYEQKYGKIGRAHV